MVNFESTVQLFYGPMFLNRYSELRPIFQIGNFESEISSRRF